MMWIDRRKQYLMPLHNKAFTLVTINSNKLRSRKQRYLTLDLLFELRIHFQLREIFDPKNVDLRTTCMGGYVSTIEWKICYFTYGFTETWRSTNYGKVLQVNCQYGFYDFNCFDFAAVLGHHYNNKEVDISQSQFEVKFDESAIKFMLQEMFIMTQKKMIILSVFKLFPVKWLLLQLRNSQDAAATLCLQVFSIA